jgi:hypothetical protein
MSLAIDDLKVLEIFPQSRAVPQYFAEFGEKLPQKLKNGVTLFLLSIPTAPAPAAVDDKENEVSVENELAEPVKKRKRKSKKEEPVEPEPEPTVPEKPAKKIPVREDPNFKLYLKATQDGVLGKKGELIEAQKIPSGTVVHLVKGRKYVKTKIYYENFWYDF